MIYPFDKLKNDALEGCQMHTSVSHGGDANITIKNFLRGTRIDYQMNIDVLCEQI